MSRHSLRDGDSKSALADASYTMRNLVGCTFSLTTGLCVM